MSATPSPKLIVFDYSGTLSLEAPRFARSESLMRAFAESGLASLGLANTEMFWEQIVNPTWIKGSTTTAGYRRVMAEKINELRIAPGASAEEIDAATSRFVKTYLDHSPIDHRWRSLLARLDKHPEIMVIIATDHYAEATGKIHHNLASWNISAGIIGTTSVMPHAHAGFFIANSADIGFWKEEVRFWEILNAQLSRDKITKLLLIDDFGFNEEAGDTYGGELTKITRRQERTQASLLEVFQVKTEIIPFYLDGETRYNDEAVTRLIAETALRIDRFLE